MNRAGIAVSAAAAVFLFTGFGPPDPDRFGAADLARSVAPLAPNVSDLTRNVTDVADRTRDGDDELITLKSDILFAFGKATLNDAARALIATLVAKVPKKARLYVGGHTDSIGSTASNQALSTARARAVADIVRGARPDLKLTVHGFGETRPVAPNTRGGKDYPAGRAENRRVELRYRA